jgi:hypothetical protein
MLKKRGPPVPPKRRSNEKKKGPPPPPLRKKPLLSNAITKARNSSRKRGMRDLIRKASKMSGSRRRLQKDRDVKLRGDLDNYLEKYLNDIAGVEKRYNDSIKKLKVMQEKMKKKFGNFSDYVADGGNDMTSIVSLSDSLLRHIEDAIVQQVCRPVDLVVDTFHRMAPMMKMYNQYIIQYNDFILTFRNMKERNKKFKKFCKKQGEAPESLMIKPVQQIPRYKLILMDLQRHLPSDDTLVPKLREATKLVSEAADHCNKELEKHTIDLLYNDVKKRFSGKLKKFNDNPKRVVIKEGHLEKIGGFGFFQDRVFVLFNDCLAYGKGKIHGKVNIRNVLNFGTFEVFPDSSEECQFEIRIRKGSATAKDKKGLSKSKVYVIRAESKFDVMTWIQSIHNSMEKAGVEVSQSDFYGENFWGETMDWEKQISNVVEDLCEPSVWAYASSLFAQKPFSDGDDDRYDEVRAMITKQYGENAINTSNEMWLKMLAKSRGSQSITSTEDLYDSSTRSTTSTSSTNSSKAAKLLGLCDGPITPPRVKTDNRKQRRGPPPPPLRHRARVPSTGTSLMKVMISALSSESEDDDAMDGPIEISSEDENW